MREEDEKSSKGNLSYLLYESALAKSERANKRMFILVIILTLMLFFSNLAWIIYENQFEDISIEQEVDTGEGNAYVAGGDIYGAGETDNQDP